MPESERKKLLRKITRRISDAFQADLEHGVSSLNKEAAAEFGRRYPELAATLDWIFDLYFTEAE